MPKFFLGFCAPEAFALGDWRVYRAWQHMLIKCHEVELHPFRLKIIFHILRRDSVEKWWQLSSSKLLFIFLSLPGMPFTTFFSSDNDPSSMNKFKYDLFSNGLPLVECLILSQNSRVTDTGFNLLSQCSKYGEVPIEGSISISSSHSHWREPLQNWT